MKKVETLLDFLDEVAQTDEQCFYVDRYTRILFNGLLKYIISMISLLKEFFEFRILFIL